MKTVTLYRPTGRAEWQLVVDSGYKKWPPRLVEQPIFYPVTNQRYAEEIAEKWNVPARGVGIVTRFEVKLDFMQQYDVQNVGAHHHTEWWIPAEDLDSLNNNIVGLIEKVSEFK